jgi:uncharacterized membrane protein
MMRRALIAFALVFLAASPAMAQKPGVSSATAANELTIRVCNESGRNAFTAVLDRSAGEWHSEGWFRVNNGACEDIAVSDNLRFYVFAEEVDNIDYYWAGAHEHCIWRPGPYDDVIDPNVSVCRDGQESVMFVEWLADNYGTFTWTLDP